MWEVRDVVAYSLEASVKVLDRFVADLTPQEWLHRPVPKANCAAWIVGHLILSDRRALGRLGVKDLPALPDGFERRFGRGEDAPAAIEFGDVSILRPLFSQHRQLLIDAAMRMPADGWDAPMDIGHPMFKTAGEMLQFMPFHSTMHAGQISTIRRSLGRPPVV